MWSGLLQVTPYASDELVLIVPRHHELAKNSSIELGELQNLPLVSLNQVCAHPAYCIFAIVHAFTCVSDSPPFQHSAGTAPPVEALAGAVSQNAVPPCLRGVVLHQHAVNTCVAAAHSSLGAM